MIIWRKSHRSRVLHRKSWFSACCASAESQFSRIRQLIRCVHMHSAYNRKPLSSVRFVWLRFAFSAAAGCRSTIVGNGARQYFFGAARGRGVSFFRDTFRQRDSTDEKTSCRNRLSMAPSPSHSLRRCGRLVSSFANEHVARVADARRRVSRCLLVFHPRRQRLPQFFSYSRIRPPSHVSEYTLLLCSSVCSHPASNLYLYWLVSVVVVSIGAMSVCDRLLYACERFNGLLCSWRCCRWNSGRVHGSVAKHARGH